ncbi:Crp/Fnr family transcriptional regulator [Aegicerativicinus sediminis]
MSDEHYESRCENCIIRELNTLRALKKEELKDISDHKTTRSVKKGETLFFEGERLNGVFCVRKGVSKLSKRSENGKDQIIKLATKGNVMGQIAVITQETADLTAVALDDMEVCFIPKNHIEQGLASNPDFTNAVLKKMTSDLKEADHTIVSMAQKTVKQRLAATLLTLEETFGVDEDGYIGMTISRADISNIIGTATELCIRTLASFKKEDYISTSGKKIKLEDKVALQHLVEGY